MRIEDLVEALSDPLAYPFAVDAIEVRQTHISAVFLAGSMVYKVKKPVQTGFLDFRTLESRRHFCDEEVRLNRRLAPRVYQGVAPITRRGDGRLQVEGDGEVIEWAVKMNRLPDRATLQESVQSGTIESTRIEALARRIAKFHRFAETNDRIAEHGRFENVEREFLALFSQVENHIGETVVREVFDRVQALVEAELQRQLARIDDRARRGMPRDCHGDLHLDHVYVFPDAVPPDDMVIIDCIEFNDRFRHIDPVADMAFPAMDLKFLGRRDLASLFAATYFHQAGDHEGAALLSLYVAYRAVVRATVEGMMLNETEISPHDRESARKRSRAHWLLALGELEVPPRRPGLVLIGGLPGTGKSRLAEELAMRAGFHVVRSDVVRKSLAGVRPDHHLSDKFYQPEWTNRTYAECLRVARDHLLNGERVIVDATFRDEDQRRAFLDAATDTGVPGLLLICQADDATVQHRLDQRRGDASDATWTTHRRLSRTWQDIGPATRRNVRTISTNGAVLDGVALALIACRDSGLWE